MSKYSVVVTPSRWRRYQAIIPLAALGLSFACMPDAATSYLPEHSLLAVWVSVATGLACYLLHQPALSAPVHWHVTQEGEVQLTPSHEQPAPVWHLSEDSRVTWWGLFLVLHQDAKPVHRRWLLKGEVSEQNYRRLCRILTCSHAKY